jgi:hypothetical protein
VGTGVNVAVGARVGAVVEGRDGTVGSGWTDNEQELNISAAQTRNLEILILESLDVWFLSAQAYPGIEMARETQSRIACQSRSEQWPMGLMAAEGNVTRKARKAVARCRPAAAQS